MATPAASVTTALSMPVHAVGSYQSALGQAVQRLKYSARPDLATPLGRLLIPHAPAGPWDGIIPVPLHPTRLAQRGYNQAALLARPLARALQLPLRCDLLQRQRLTTAQATLSAQERRVNLKEAFHVSQPAAVRGKRWLLVDDVATTGSTLQACAAALQQHEAPPQAALVLAIA